MQDAEVSNNAEDSNDAEVAFGESSIAQDASKKSPRFVKLLYNHNPFYLISACLVLYGIRTSFHDENQVAMDPWILASLFAGYIGLLALTSCLIVRFGRVWDDARSIFMVLFLLFFALSVSFDSLCISAPSTAVIMLSMGFLFSVFMTESILWSLKIKFPALFRGPCYLMLGLTFFYPLLWVVQREHFPDFDTRWLLALFPVLCSAAILSLIPAARKGAKYVSKNGTPWCWPLFPYAAFVLLIVGLCGRTALLAMAFDPSTGTGSIFGCYFLVPIFIACLILILEIGIVEKMKWLCSVGFWISPVAILLAINGSTEFGQNEFYKEVTELFGSPVWLAICALLIVYGVSAIRRIPEADVFFAGLVVVAVVIGRDGRPISSIDEIAIWPCLILAAMQLRCLEFRKMSWKWMVAAFWLTPIVVQAAFQFAPSELQWPIAVHWLLVAACSVGFAFHDRFALELRVYAALALPVFAIGAVGVSVFAGQAKWSLVAYVFGLAVLGAIVFQFSRNKLFQWTAAATFGIGLISLLVVLRGQLPIANGLARFILLGLICFCVGVFVSCLKAGLGPRITKSFNRMVLDVQMGFRRLEEGVENLQQDS